MVEKTMPPASRPHSIWIMAICFFASGFSGLSYEICWIRKASLIFGSTTFAMSIVTAVFFGGLAIGSYLFGQYSRKIARPLMVYAFLEVGLGVIALLNPEMFVWAENLYRYFYPALIGSVTLLLLARLTLVTLVILPPTILMGATLPLFCSYYVNNKDKISLTVSMLYALNTLGAAIGTAVTGFKLIPIIGINKTIWLAAAINIVIGLVAYRQQRLTASMNIPLEDPSSNPAGRAEKLGRDERIIYGLFFLSGFVAIGTEVLWVRYLSLLIHNTVYTYTVTLTTTLAGIVLGSLLISKWGDRTRFRALWFGMVHMLNSLIVLSLMVLPADLWQKIMSSVSSSSRNAWIITLLLLVPSVLSGISFPLAIRMAVDRPSLVGSRVGSMYAINTVGGILGSLLVGFLLLPYLGLQKSLFLTTALSFLIGGGALLFLEQSISPKVKFALVFLGFACWVSIPMVTGTQLPMDFLHESTEKLIDYREGLEVNFAVKSAPHNNGVELDINRLWQGTSLKNQQIMAAHVPMMFHQNPKSVLVVGVGVGKTASRFLYYDVNRLDCVDVDSSLFDIIRKNFDSKWMDDKRVHLITEDGRNYINNTDSKYDVISVEVGQTFRPGISSFYTLDFYQHARSRLNANGILCQFIPIDLVNVAVFRSMINSFLQVFPNSVLWYNKNELLLLGSPSGPLELTANRLKLLNTDSAINTDLRYNHFGGPDFYLNRKDIFLSCFLSGPQGLAKLAAGAPVYRDDLPTLEYYIFNEHDTGDRILNMIVENMDSVATVFHEKLDASSLSEINKVRELNIKELMAINFLNFNINQNENDIPNIENALKLNPYNVVYRFSLAQALQSLGQKEQALAALNECLRIDPDLKVTRELGRIFLKGGH
jgi:spermidine synthase